MKIFPLYFVAGCFGAVVNTAAIWLCDNFGIIEAAQVSMRPEYTEAWFYRRIVWGGLCGLLFFLPVGKSNLFFKATLISLVPSVFQLLYVYPYQLNAGFGGTGLGAMTPVLILFFNWIWAVATAMGIKSFR